MQIFLLYVSSLVYAHDICMPDMYNDFLWGTRMQNVNFHNWYNNCVFKNFSQRVFYISIVLNELVSPCELYQKWGSRVFRISYFYRELAALLSSLFIKCSSTDYTPTAISEWYHRRNPVLSHPWINRKFILESLSKARLWTRPLFHKVITVLTT